MSKMDEYWEFYDDQTSDQFGELSYVDLKGDTVRIPTETDLAAQVYEIRRRCGIDTEVRVYAREAAAVV